MMQKTFKPEELGEVKPQVQSILDSFSKTYGLDLGAKESNAIIKDALRNLKNKEPDEVHKKVQNALLAYLSKTDYERAKTLYNQIEGKKYWESLGLDRVAVHIQGKEMALGDALDECSRLKGESRAERFREIISELAEKFRTRSNMQNSLGIRYSEKSTDPEEIITKKAFNCFSGSIILGQLITYAAGEVQLESEVDVKVQQVASYTLGGKWDDAGHAIVKVVLYGLGDEKKRVVFFDPMNTVIARHEQSLKFDPNSGILSSSLLGNIHYRLGKTLDITPNLVKTAQFQDKLFEMQTLDSKTISGIAKMPPLFLSYFVNHMTAKQQREFFSSLKERDLAKIESPALRYKLAAVAASAFAESNPNQAFRFGTLALSSLKEAIESEITQLPLGASLDNTINLISFMQRTPKGKAMVADSGVWAYLAYVASTSIAEITPAGAGKARDFLVGFYNENRAFVNSFASKNPLVLINYCQGLLTLSSIGGRTIMGEEALSSLYESLGINRTLLIKKLKDNALGATIMGMGKEQIEKFVSGEKNIDYFLERNFLIVTADIFRGNFSLDRAKRAVAGHTGPSAIIGKSILMAFEESFENVLLANGPVSKAARKIGLI